MDEKTLLDAIRTIVREENAPIKEELQEIKQRVLKIEITQENTIAKQINLLVEGHIGTVEKLRSLDTLAEKVDDIQDTVEVLKHIVVQK